MDERFESFEQGWRRPTSYEQDSVIKWMKEQIQDRLLGCYLGGGFTSFGFLLLSLVIGSEKVRGEYQIMSGILTFVISTSIIVGVCALYNLRQYLLLRKAKAGEFTITKREVLDKIAIVGRGYDLVRELGHGCHVTVEIKEGEKKHICMSTNAGAEWFDKVSLGTEVTLIKYNDDSYGFYGEVDCTVIN